MNRVVGGFARLAGGWPSFQDKKHAVLRILASNPICSLQLRLKKKRRKQKKGEEGEDDGEAARGGGEKEEEKLGTKNCLINATVLLPFRVDVNSRVSRPGEILSARGKIARHTRRHVR